MPNISSDIGLQPSQPDMIPIADPEADVRSCRGAILEAIDRVLCSGRYILGEEVDGFEQEWAQYLGARYAIGVANGTDALALALKGVGIHPGDEVLTVSHTAVATLAAIESIGAVPVLVDMDPSSRCMDPRLLESMVSPRTRAVVPVHIYGQPADMERILAVAGRYDLRVVEDCAQAHGGEIGGQKVGTFGVAAAFSFYPTKNLGAIGDAGAVVCSDASLADRVRALRQYGWQRRYISHLVGTNSRLDELQAAVLRIQLKQLDERNVRRRAIAERYRRALASTGVVVPQEASGTMHVMHLFVIESMQRDRLAEFLEKAGIATGLHYPQPVHLQPAYLGRLRGSERLPVTEAFYQRLLTLPCHPGLTDEQINRISRRLQAWSEPSSASSSPVHSIRGCPA